VGKPRDSIDLAHSLAALLVEVGVVYGSDEEVATEVAAIWLARHGLGPTCTLSRSAYSRAEQRRIVDEYVALAKTTNDPARRSAKIRDLGVSPEIITHWARKHYGPGHLQRARPTPTLRLILDWLATHPWSTRQEILLGTGAVRTSMPGALDWGRRKGRLQRRMGEHGLYEYARAG